MKSLSNCYIKLCEIIVRVYRVKKSNFSQKPKQKPKQKNLPFLKKFAKKSNFSQKGCEKVHFCPNCMQESPLSLRKHTKKYTFARIAPPKSGPDLDKVLGPQG